MSASPLDDDSPLPVAHTAAGLGLHRGRRVLAGSALAGLLICSSLALLPDRAPLPLEAAPAALLPAADDGLVALRRAPAKRRSKSARSAARESVRAPVKVEREQPLSAPPLVAAVPEPEPAAPAVEPESQVATAPWVPVEPEPEAEVADDGNAEAIARAIAAQKRGAVQTCFERALKQSPTLKGTLIIELDLAPPHLVNQVRVSDDLDQPAFTQCISSTMEQVSFAALNEEVTVRVPYVLSARAK